MMSICAWCTLSLGMKEPLEDLSATHGICDKCAVRVLKEIEPLLREVA